MTTLSLDVRKQLWAWYYGRRAFEHCKVCCDYMLTKNMTDEHPLYYPLNVAAHISYGRPFKRSKGIETLSEAIVPDEFRAAHEQLMITRDKVFAHTDAVGDAGLKADRTVDVTCEIKRTGLELGILEIAILPVGIANISKLSSILIEKATYHLEKITKRHGKEFPSEPGKFRIGIDPNETAFAKVKSDG